jgi:hypothetical protein
MKGSHFLFFFLFILIVLPCLTVLSAQTSPTPSVTPNCSLKPKGDANCDCVVDAADYTIWRNEYLKVDSQILADFSQAAECKTSDGAASNICLYDLDIWREGIQSNLTCSVPSPTTIATRTPTAVPPTPTRTPTPTIAAPTRIPSPTPIPWDLTLTLSCRAVPTRGLFSFAATITAKNIGTKAITSPWYARVDGTMYVNGQGPGTVTMNNFSAGYATPNYQNTAWTLENFAAGATATATTGAGAYNPGDIVSLHMNILQFYGNGGNAADANPNNNGATCTVTMQ